jgi:coenzyme PQQ precursor peptide PqqA
MSFMTMLIHWDRRRQNMEPYLSWRFVMKWETPQAIELRFGMEITMYVANR